jgi:hypothetical protein
MFARDELPELVLLVPAYKVSVPLRPKLKENCHREL